MKTFQWSPLFETGLDEVDAQHRRLVELVNDLGDKLDSGEPERIDATLTALADYTVYHFGCEEALMDAAGVDAEYAERHRDTHRRFVQQVTDWMEQRHVAGTADHLHSLPCLAIAPVFGDDRAVSVGRLEIPY